MGLLLLFNIDFDDLKAEFNYLGNCVLQLIYLNI